MAEASRTDDTGITLRIKFKSETIDKFVERYGVDLSPGGIFIRTREPLAVGTKLSFDFTLFSGSSLMSGQGVVAWVRDPETARAGVASGMGIRFERLLGDSQAVLNKLLAERAKRQGAPQVRYTAPLMEAVRTGPEGEAASPLNRPFKESPSAVGVPPRTTPAGGVSASGRSGDAWGSDDKTEIAALPPSFYFDKADKALAEEAGSLAKAVPPRAVSARAPTPSPEAPRATPPGVIPAIATSNDGTPSGPRPTPPAGLAAVEPSGEKPTVDISSAAAVATDPYPTPVGGTASPSTPTPIGVPAAMPRVETALGIEPSGPRESSSSMPLAELGGRALADDRPLAPVQQAPKRSSAGIAIGVAAVVAILGIWLLPKLMGSRHEAPAPEPTPAATAPVPVETPSATPAPSEPAAAAPASVAPTESAKPAATPEPAAEPAKPAAAPEAAPVEKPAEKAPEKKPVAAKPAKPAKVVKPARSVAKATREPAAEPGAEAAKAAEGAAEAPAAAEGAPAAEAEKLDYFITIKSTPSPAEVFIDGQPEGKTPLQRRIYDINRSYSVSVRRAGFEPFERTVSASDDWTKKGNARSLVITAKLGKVAVEKDKEAAPTEAAPETAPAPAAPATPPTP